VDIIFVYGAVKYTKLDVMATSAVPHVDAATATLGFWEGSLWSGNGLRFLYHWQRLYLSLPRMLYECKGKSGTQGFAKIHPKYRVPMYGIIFTVFLILLTTVYISLNGELPT
jgi:amino acid transporter